MNIGLLELKVRHPLLAPVLQHLLGFAVLAGLIALNRWLFAVWLGADYLAWYRANADKLAFALTIATTVWSDEMERHTGLISTNPLDQFGSYLQLMGITVRTIGTAWRSRERGAASPFDVLMGVPVLAVFLAGVLAWLLFVAPLQYFVQLVCGAPSRVAQAGSLRTVACWDGTSLEAMEIERAAKTPNGWWATVFAEKPVKFTAAFATMLMVALKAFHLL